MNRGLFASFDKFALRKNYLWEGHPTQAAWEAACRGRCFRTLRTNSAWSFV